MGRGAASGGRGRPITAAELLQRIAASGGPRSVLGFEHGTLRVKMYAPRGTDTQTPHSQDEVYVVLKGRGRFACADESWEFGEGDTLFAPAGVAHRFEEFSNDLAVWVFFYGPDGGER